MTETIKLKIVTTIPLPIINNKVALPSIPIGQFVFNSTMVLTDFGQEEHDEIEMQLINGRPFMVFLEQDYDFSYKYAVVSYACYESSLIYSVDNSVYYSYQQYIDLDESVIDVSDQTNDRTIPVFFTQVHSIPVRFTI